MGRVFIFFFSPVFVQKIGGLKWGKKNIFALALGTWRGSSSYSCCCCWLLCTEIVPPTFDPPETHAHVLCDKLASCWGLLLLSSLVVMLLFFSFYILYYFFLFSTNWLFYWITQAAGGNPRHFPETSSGLRDYIGLNSRMGAVGGRKSQVATLRTLPLRVSCSLLSTLSFPFVAVYVT